MIRKFIISGLDWPVGNRFTFRSSRPAYRHLAVPALMLAIGVLIVLKTPCARSQVVTATLQGTVQDHSGAMIQKATVTVTNTSTNISTTALTNSEGRFVFPALLPGGPYTVKADAPGFKTSLQAGIHLDVNQMAAISLVMEVGSQSQQVQVTADATQLQTTDASIGQVINNRDVVNLPLNARNVFSLMFLVPGVVGGVSFQYNSLNMSVDGGRPGSTNILIDGIPASPTIINPIGGFSVFPSVDAVQQFKMQANAYSTEFGRTGSGIVNVILKSGTNQFHGSLYEFLRNSALDSNTFFNNRAHKPLPLFHRSQFGISLTGPVFIPKLYDGRDKTFFLFSYEGLRQGTESEVTTSVPTALEDAGDFSQTLDSSGQLVTIYDPATTVLNPISNTYTRQSFTSEYKEGPGNTAFCGGDINCIPASRMDPVAAAILKYYPPPNQPGTTSGQNNYFASGVSTLNINTFDSRVDETINAHNQMFVSYEHRALDQPPTILFPKAYSIAEGGQNQPQTANTAAIDYTHDFGPNFIMEVPFGFARSAINFTPLSAGFDPVKELGFPSYIDSNNPTNLLFPGIGPANYYTLGDAAPGQTRHGGFNMFYLGVRNSKVYKNHLISFGGEAMWLQANDEETQAPTGSYSFSQALTQGPNPNVATQTAGNAVASLLLGLGSGGTYVVDSKNAATTSRYFAAYIQDDWQALPKLSVNLGLRYSLEIPRTERYNRMETFNPTEATPLAAATGLTSLTGGVDYVGVNGASRRQFKPRYFDFDPRVGFSYQIDPNTVVRSSYGIYYMPSLRAAGATVGNEGFSSTTSYVGSVNGLTPSTFLSNPFPTGINLPVGSSLGALTGIGTSFENPLYGDNIVGYTENWELDVQRQLPDGFLVDTAYIGSHGLHLNKAGENDWNTNQLTTNSLALGTQLEQSVPNPFYNIIKTGPEDGVTIPQSYLQAPFPQFTAVYLSFLTSGYVDYNSFQLKVNKRLSQGLTLLVAYTWSKQIDDYSGIENEGNITGGIQNIYNADGERSLSSDNLSQNFVVSGVYDLPFGRGRQFGATWNRGLNAVLGGWQINGIATEQDGFPLSPNTQNTSDSGSNTERPNVVPGVTASEPGAVINKLTKYVNSAAFSQPAPFTFGDAPRTLSYVLAPGYHDIDFSAFKSFQPTRRVAIEFRAEAFNLLNQVQFGHPNMTLSSGQFGVISGQSNTPRQIQAAVKILW